MKRTLLIPLVLALVVGAAVFIVRRRPSEETSLPSTPAVSRNASEIAPAPLAAPVDPASPAPELEGKPDLRSAFDALLEALRSGDRDRIRGALGDLEGVLVPDPVPDEENAALVYQQAFEKLSEFTDEEQEAYGLLADGKPLTAEQQETMKRLLERNREALSLLREAAGRPKCRFPIDYAAGFQAELSHVTKMIGGAKLLLVASMMEGGPGRESMVHTSWKLAEALGDEPFLVSQLVRSVCHSISMETRQADWGRRDNHETLRRWVRELDPGIIRAGLERSLLFELYSGTRQLVDDEVPDTFFALNGIERPKGPLAAQALAEYAETMSEYAALSGRPYYEVKDKLAELERVKLDGAPWYDVYSRQLLPALSRAASRQAETEASFGATRIASAVELYRRQTGVYPPSLDDLQGFLPEPPRDPFTGKDFVYRREGSGFIVYSLGTDGADGGGSGDHDVVFRSPR